MIEVDIFEYCAPGFTHSNDQIRRAYVELMRDMLIPDYDCTVEHMLNIRDDQREILLFARVDGQIVSTAQGSLCRTSPPELLVNGVATLRSHQGRGIGKKVMSALESLALARVQLFFGTNQYKSTLTNSPRKGNGEFYLRCGYDRRGPDDEKPTIVYQKKVSA